MVGRPQNRCHGWRPRLLALLGAASGSAHAGSGEAAPREPAREPAVPVRRGRLCHMMPCSVTEGTSTSPARSSRFGDVEPGSAGHLICAAAALTAALEMER